MYHQRAPAGRRMSLLPPLTGSITRRVRRDRANARSPRRRARSFIESLVKSQYAKIQSGSRTRRRTRFAARGAGALGTGPAAFVLRERFVRPRAREPRDLLAAPVAVFRARCAVEAPVALVFLRAIRGAV
jgi:hypothetical protein